MNVQYRKFEGDTDIKTKDWIEDNINWIEDPGHGWLKVHRVFLTEIGISESLFTPYSFKDTFFVYLEEDLDASVFAKAYQEKTGFTFWEYAISTEHISHFNRNRTRITE